MKIYTCLLLCCFLNGNISVAQNEYGLQFDGVNDFVDCGVPAGYVFDDLTMMCWVKTTAAPSSYQALVAKDGFTSDFSLLAHHTNIGDITFGGDGLGQLSGGVINDGIWHFVAGTRDGSTGKLKLYIDGILIDSTSGGTDPLSNSEHLHFGKYHPSNPHYYQGSLDEISIWDIELTAAQILFYMVNCPAGNEVGLKGYWSLDEGTGGTANDATNNNNDGILLNGVLWTTDTPSTCILADVSIEQADLYIKSLTKGIIMKSPDGQCWKIMVSNSGTMSTVSIACPN